jgi:hypothetical protein
MLLIGITGTVTYGQQGTITANDDFPIVNNRVFTCRPVQPLRKGDAEPANYILGDGCTSVWTARVHRFEVGGHTVRYPVHGVINCSGISVSSGVVATTTVIKVDIKAGEIVDSGTYQMKAARAVKRGEVVPTLLFFQNKQQSVMSIEAAQTTKGNREDALPQPWLTIFDKRLSPKVRNRILETWRASNKTVESMLKTPSGLLPNKISEDVQDHADEDKAANRN